MKAAFGVIPTLFAMSLPVLAQGAEAFTPQSVWEHFKQTCSAIIQSPDAYLASIQSPGPSGERVISVSPDQNAVSVYVRKGNLYEEIYLHIVGKRQLRQCIVIGEFYDMDSEALVSTFENVVSTDVTLTMTGGHVPQDYVTEGSTYTVDKINAYVVDGAWPEKGLIISVHIIDGELQLAVDYLVN